MISRIYQTSLLLPSNNRLGEFTPHTTNDAVHNDSNDGVKCHGNNGNSNGKGEKDICVVVDKRSC